MQDLSAQRAADLLDLEPGQRVLDACAAPGGKTGHILEVLAGRGEVWAVDRDAARLRRVRDNLERLGLAATLKAGDATAPADWWDGRLFDRILLDAPCSAIGRDSPPPRHQGAAPARGRRARRGAAGAAAAGALAAACAAGGRLVYATCSVLKTRE